MSCDNGHNPMEWNCEKQGCFNLKKRPKIEVFAECFPGRISFSDVDALCEINGNLLFLEWKEDGRSLKTGQRILCQRITNLCPAVVFIVEGNAETMEVESYRMVYEGKFSPPLQDDPIAVDLAGLKQQFTEWAEWATQNPAMKKYEHRVIAF